MLDAVRRMLRELLPDPRANSSLVEKIEICWGRTPSYIAVECRRNEDGLFGMMTVDSDDCAGTIYLGHPEFKKLVRGLTDFAGANAAEFLNSSVTLDADAQTVEQKIDGIVIGRTLRGSSSVQGRTVLCSAKCKYAEEAHASLWNAEEVRMACLE